MEKIIKFKKGSIYLNASKDLEDDLYITPAITLLTPSMLYEQTGAKSWSIGIRFFWWDCFVAWMGKRQVKQPKRMDLKEFREQGFLQEVNRKFFHPLGLALEFHIDRNGKTKFRSVWDYRNSEGGLIYDLQNSEPERIERFRKNALNVEMLRDKIAGERIEKNGWIIEPIPFGENEEENVKQD